MKRISKEGKIRLVWLALVLALTAMTIIGGCTQRNDKPILVKPSATPTVTGELTDTPAATNTATPTETPSPTPTNTPAPQPTKAAAAPTPTPEMAGENYFIGAGGRKIYIDRPMLAITIDDGPYPWFTKPLMDIFEQYESRATFFVCGYKLANYPDTTKEAYQRGFQIGNHTMNHKFLDRISIEDASWEVRRNEELIRQYAGVQGTILLRPPYGAYNAEVAAMVGVPMIGWNVESGDWMVKDNGLENAIAAVKKNVLAGAGDGNIILCHDLYECTYKGLLQAIPELIARGYQLVTVDELFFAKGITPSAGRYYTSVK